MAKKWAKKFYNTKQWRATRNAYFHSQNGICELCGKPGEEVHHKIYLTSENIDDPNITLDWDNLQLLCKACHFAIHEKAFEIARYNRNKSPVIDGKLEFDSNGNIKPKKNIYIVWGSPASGKTTYVKENKDKHDLVMDLDYLMRALYISDTRPQIEDAYPFARDMRDYFYEMVKERKYHFNAVWIIAGLPFKKTREELANKMNAELIYIESTRESSIEKAKKDDSRLNKEHQFKLINKYFDELEL
ncbi:HNH endonuclease [Staphylococcus hominis]|uniref:HNH endonuclease n=1 Tax=Staphylococcus hominis TaxID=1290 RepID=UPI00118BB453|nr:HNH endonuclease signature motif containing protein [Staphylococcus hominis]QDW86494.1 HNH endonuclease [Staphylococcus hominis]